MSLFQNQFLKLTQFLWAPPVYFLETHKIYSILLMENYILHNNFNNYVCVQVNFCLFVHFFPERCLNVAIVFVEIIKGFPQGKYFVPDDSLLQSKPVRGQTILHHCFLQLTSHHIYITLSVITLQVNTYLKYCAGY